MSDLDQQRNRKLLKKVVSSKLNSFNLDENAGPFIPFENDTQQKILEGLSTIQSWVLMARLDRTSGCSNTKEVTLTCLATPYSLLTSSTQRSQSRICLQYAFSPFFLIKKNNRSKRANIYFTTLGREQCHNLNEFEVHTVILRENGQFKLLLTTLAWLMIQSFSVRSGSFFFSKILIWPFVSTILYFPM